MPKFAALIVSAGRGERVGGPVPKQFQSLLGISLLRRSVEAFVRCSEIGPVQVVVGDGQAERSYELLTGLDCLPFVDGGATRQVSVRNGLEALSRHAPDYVLIHDAARPLVSNALIGRVMDALMAGAAAAIPLVAVADTLKREDARGWSTTPRDGLFRAQTPQGFRFDDILAAHRIHAAHAATDDMVLAERAGMRILPVQGEELNLKITAPEDLAHAEKLLLATMDEFRTGSGFDAHRFTAGDHVWLCGVKIPHSAGLEGHSDADAGLHALTDAILGALGAGDIGDHFPPSDEKWRGAPSSLFLAHALELVRSAGGAVVHCDLTLICERPKIAPHRETMRARIAEILGIGVARVSVKATTMEGMGFTGRQEGLVAQAVATVRLPNA
jgi:2-C-methyl-D-erythritol 4-phosphate cytidylyltransferase/2-C-methyl-D-erythritol 2,4-cyclodiphosphate synthase